MIVYNTWMVFYLANKRRDIKSNKKKNMREKKKKRQERTSSEAIVNVKGTFISICPEKMNISEDVG